MNFDIRPYLSHLRRMIIIAFIVGVFAGIVIGFAVSFLIK